MSGSKHRIRNLLLTGTVLALGFVAVMLATADRSSAQMRAYHDLHGTWLGVSIQDVTEELAKEKKLSVDEGAFVNEVVEDSPAEEAGIRAGDVVVKFDDRDIDDADDLLRAVRRTDPGKTVGVVVIRDGKEQSLTATVKERRRPYQAFQLMPRIPGVPKFFSGTQLGGMLLQELSRQLGEYFGVPDGRGVLVTEVEEGTAADEAGFKAGDVIVRVGDERVKDVEDVWDGLEDLDEGEKAKFEIIRKGEHLRLEFSVEEPEDMSFERFRFWYPEHGWSITVPEIPKEELEDFQEEMERLQEEMQDMMKEFQKKLQKEMRDLRVDIRTIAET